MDAGDAFLLWSHKHGAWWRPGGAGYTGRLGEAGWFALDEAVELAAKAMPGTAHRMNALPVLPVPLWAATAMQAAYKAKHPDRGREPWE